MKVLHVVAGNLDGGIESMLRTIARHAAACPRMEPQFALCFTGRLADELESVGARVHALGPVRSRYPWTLLPARRRLRGILERERFQAVICHSVWSLAVFAPAVRLTLASLVLWLHDPWQGNHWLERWAGRSRPSRILCNSGYTLGTLPPKYAGIHSTVIHCPVEPAPPLSATDRAQIRGALGASDRDVVILQASRMQKWKGHIELLGALADLRDLRGWRVWIAGGVQRSSEKRYERELIDLVAATRLGDRVSLLGHRNDVRRLFGSADVYCQPNTAPEPFGISLVEALAAGLPVVTTRMGGAIEVVDSSCGILVPPKDRAALVTALRTVVTDPIRRQTLASAGPGRARENWHPKRILGQLERELAEGGPEQPA
jgi:glycosyltransferase involved in cell wall biosynthesis